jgi:hypothetical protein
MVGARAESRRQHFFFLLLPQMHLRHLVWGAGLSAVTIAAGARCADDAARVERKLLPR